MITVDGGNKTRNSRIEFAAIASLICIFIFLEMQFGVFAAISLALSLTLPGFKSYSLALFVGAWFGLTTYSLIRRRDLRNAIEEKQKVEEEFELSKIRDSVTGLPNGYAFHIVLEDKLRLVPRDPMSILGLEICNLDTISSVHGTAAAARAEVMFANKISSLIGPKDFVARGDHAMFYTLATGGSVDENRFRIDGIIEEIVAFSTSGLEVDGVNLQAYVTFGILDIDDVAFGGPEWDAKNILRRVDFARHKARRRGNQAVEIFDKRMENALHERAIIEASISGAIRNNEIVPYFQPLIDLSSQKVVGLEVLARWNHQSLGAISPGVFIPIAEDIGVLRLLTLSILRQACTAALAWPNHIRIAVNVSPTDLRDPAVTRKFIAVLNETGIKPERIEVEITENAFIEEAGQIAGAISSMKQEGISISIDDFGTGYSSLHHLRILPFDKIKIDQSFVRDMATNQESKAIVQSVIAMAKGLGLKTTAEGIELHENEDLLKDLGCSLGQGMLYAKPLPAEEVLPFVLRYEQGVVETDKVSSVA